MKKHKTIATILGLLVVAITTVVIARETPWSVNDPESAHLEQMLRDGKITPEMWSSLQEENSRKEAYSNLSSEERIAIKQESYQDYLEKQANNVPTVDDTKLVQKKFVGILDAQSVPYPFSVTKPSEFKVVNFWGGNTENVSVNVFSGYDTKNPNIGTLLVFVGDENFFVNITENEGPVRITAENDGVLTLTSLSGEYEVYDEVTEIRSYISKTGGIIYHFNLKTRMFE